MSPKPPTSPRRRAASTYPAVLPLSSGSYREIARRAGLSPTHVSRALRGQTGMSFDVAGKIAAAAGVSLAEVQRAKALITWPPLGGDYRKRFNKEVAAPAAICLKLIPERTQIEPKAQAELLAWLRKQSSGMGGLIEGGARSWNHPQLLMAARGLHFDDWGDFPNLMKMQSGLGAGLGAAQWLDGEEPRSTDYDHFRWIAEILYLGEHGGDEATLATLRRQMGLTLLGAVPWSDDIEFKAGNGRHWYSGPTLSPVGERSPRTSNPDQLGLFTRLAMGRNYLCLREGWACAIADQVGIPLIIKSGYPTNPKELVETAIRLLGDAKTLSTFHFIEYPEGRLVYTPKSLNPNTPSALWSWANHSTQTMTRGFPFDPTRKNRGKGAPSSVGCEELRIGNGKLVGLVAESTDPAWDSQVDLPESDPLWEVVVGPEGVRRVR